MFRANSVAFCGGNYLTQAQRFGIRYWLKAFRPSAFWHCAQTDADYIAAIIASSLRLAVTGKPANRIHEAVMDAKFKEWPLDLPQKRYDRNQKLRQADVTILAPHDPGHYDSDEWQLWHQAWQQKPGFNAILLTPGGNVQTTFNPHTGEATTSWEYMRSETGKGYVLDSGPYA